MNWIPGFFRRRRLFDELSEEMRLHIEERVEQLTRDGLSPQEAERQARIAFGNPAVIAERSRAVWQWPTLESIAADIRLAVRQLRRSSLADFEYRPCFVTARRMRSIPSAVLAPVLNPP